MLTFDTIYKTEDGRLIADYGMGSSRFEFITLESFKGMLTNALTWQTQLNDQNTLSRVFREHFPEEEVPRKDY